MGHPVLVRCQLSGVSGDVAIRRDGSRRRADSSCVAVLGCRNDNGLWGMRRRMEVKGPTSRKGREKWGTRSWFGVRLEILSRGAGGGFGGKWLIRFEKYMWELCRF
jgi:hypothetical protein